jgi:hypothetical protein
MLFTLLALGCGAPEAPPPPPARWPRPGLELVLEVSARVDDEGGATAWAAGAWREGAQLADGSTDCPAPPERADVPGLAAVDVSVPVATRLYPSERGGLEAAGPLHVRDARWEVGDVRLVGDDGTGAILLGALRLGDAATVDDLTVGSGGEVRLRFAEQEGARVEVEVQDERGRTYRCEGNDGLVVLPAYIVAMANGRVVVRSVRESITVSPNEALVRVRAVVERALSLGDPLAIEKRAMPSTGGNPWCSPRRVLGLGPDLG